MNNGKRKPSLGLLICGWVSSGISHATDMDSPSRTLAAAQQCTQIEQRLERLNCFDHLFQTPVDMAGDTDVQRAYRAYPSAWKIAFETAHRHEQPLNVVVQDADSKGNGSQSADSQGNGFQGNAWVTLTAQLIPHSLKVNESPILMISCIDNLSRIELALPQPISEARVSIALLDGEPQAWRSDDSGVLLSSARGMPAITIMKMMMQHDKITLHSRLSILDGMQFDTSSLAQAITPLRQRCGW